MNERILITNDDGIFAEGIQVLSQKLFKDHRDRVEIFIVAPDHERSAVGHAITMHRPLRVEPVRFMHNSLLKGWSINGTPSDSVKLAVEYILPHPPDLVISGINRGSNLGTDILYSGTVSAAVEGTLLGIPAIALSVTEYEDSNFDLAAEFASRLLPLLLDHKLPRGTLLNINVPRGENIKGIEVTRLGTRHYYNTFEERVDPRGRSYYWLAGDVVDSQEEMGTDVAAVEQGLISVTPIHFDITCYELISYLQDLFTNMDTKI